MSCAERPSQTATDVKSATPPTVTASESPITTKEPTDQGSEHLRFKGVPIDGTLSEYVSKMKRAGFTHLSTEDGTAYLQGDFAGFKGCTIRVTTIKSVNKVNMIDVMFPEQRNWRSLQSVYQQLKNMLTEKYGNPSECVEEFQLDSYENTPVTDDDKLHKLYMDECTWYTTYSTTEGDIQLSLSKTGYVSPCIMLGYWDRINTQAVRSQAMEDL